MSSKSLKEVIKEEHGVDTLTPEEFRAEVGRRGWTKEMTRAYFASHENNSKEEVDKLMSLIYPKGN